MFFKKKMTSFNKIYGRAFTNRQSLLDVMNKNEPVKLKIIKTRDSDFKNFDEYNNKINPFTRRSNVRLNILQLKNS